jgi:predicted dehydrogenase
VPEPATHPLRIGFIGTGLIATYHSKSLRRSGANVVRAGAYDLDRTRLDAFCAASGHHACGSEEEVLDGCDAVYICTWTSEHPRLVSAAAERGLAVFCEKPLATSLAGAREMADTVTAARVTNQVGLVLRRSPAFLWLRHVITAPEAGAVMSIVFRDDQFIPTQGHYSSTWRGDVAKAGAGTLLEHSVHDIDMLEFLAGPIGSVAAQSASFHAIAGIEDVMAATIGFSSGAVGTLTSIWHDVLSRPSLRRVEVFCEHRCAELEGEGWFGPVAWTDSDGPGGELSDDALVEATRPLLDGPANPDGAFVESVLRHEPAAPDFAVAVRAHEVADAIYRSAAAGGSVALP